MSSREDILQSIRRATHVKYEKPDLKPLEDMALTYPSKVEQFYLIMKQVGGEAILLEKEEDVNDFIKKAYPGVKRIASNLKTITCATFNPDDVEDPAELNGTDLAVIDGKIGVLVWCGMMKVLFMLENLFLMVKTITKLVQVDKTSLIHF